MADFAEIDFGSLEYAAACKLRDEVLRKPLGLKLSLVDTAEEEHCRHFAMLDGDEVVACLIVKPREEVGPGTVQVRQFAVALERQGTGLGRQLMEATEAKLAQHGVKHVFLNAREPVIDFYRRLGYEPAGERFTEVGIPHQRMEKDLG